VHGLAIFQQDNAQDAVAHFGDARPASSTPVSLQRLGRLERPHTATEAAALSTELQGLQLRARQASHRVCHKSLARPRAIELTYPCEGETALQVSAHAGGQYLTTEATTLTARGHFCTILTFYVRLLRMRRDPRTNAQALFKTAAAQGGYFTAAQALVAGYTYRQQHFHRERGSWLQVDRGLFRLRDFPPGEREDLIRWSLWSRDQKGVPQAIVSHDTALAVHELSDVMPEHIHLTVPPGFRKRVPPGCVLHRAALSLDEIESGIGYLVTTPLRTLLDAADSPLSQEYVNSAVAQALERGLVRRRVLGGGRASPRVRGRLDRALEAAIGEQGTT
jgi:hypothetical protein